MLQEIVWSSLPTVCCLMFCCPMAVYVSQLYNPAKAVCSCSRQGCMQLQRARLFTLAARFCTLAVSKCFDSQCTTPRVTAATAEPNAAHKIKNGKWVAADQGSYGQHRTTSSATQPQGGHRTDKGRRQIRTTATADRSMTQQMKDGR